MADDKYSRSVSMQCSTCGGTRFEFEGKAGPYRCVGCDRTFTREELMRENGGRVDDEVEAMKGEIVKDLRAHLHKAFSGSKHIRFK